MRFVFCIRRNARQSSRFWSATLTDHHSLNFSLDTRMEAGTIGRRLHLAEL
jgi:hypothetical protein